MQSRTSWASASSRCEVVGVAGGHDGKSHARATSSARFAAILLDFDAVVLDLDEEVVAEDLNIPRGEVGRFDVAIRQKFPREFRRSHPERQISPSE